MSDLLPGLRAALAKLEEWVEKEGAACRSPLFGDWFESADTRCAADHAVRLVRALIEAEERKEQP